jgi:hypothetical protein
MADKKKKFNEETIAKFMGGGGKFRGAGASGEVKSEGVFPPISEIAGPGDIITGAKRAGITALEKVTGTTGIPRPTYPTVEVGKEVLKKYGGAGREGLNIIQERLKKIATEKGGRPVFPTAPTVPPGRVSHGEPLPPHPGEKPSPSVFPERITEKGGRKLLTNIDPVTGEYVPSPTAPTMEKTVADIEARRTAAAEFYRGKEEGGVFPDLSNLDFSSYGGLFDAISKITQYGAQQGRFNRAVASRKALADQLMDEATVNKLAAEATKSRAEALKIRGETMRGGESKLKDLIAGYKTVIEYGDETTAGPAMQNLMQLIGMDMEPMGVDAFKKLMSSPEFATKEKEAITKSLGGK